MIWKRRALDNKREIPNTKYISGFPYISTQFTKNSHVEVLRIKNVVRSHFLLQKRLSIINDQGRCKVKYVKIGSVTLSMSVKYQVSLKDHMIQAYKTLSFFSVANGFSVIPPQEKFCLFVFCLYTRWSEISRFLRHLNLFKVSSLWLVLSVDLNTKTVRNISGNVSTSERIETELTHDCGNYAH